MTRSYYHSQKHARWLCTYKSCRSSFDERRICCMCSPCNILKLTGISRLASRTIPGPCKSWLAQHRKTVQMGGESSMKKIGLPFQGEASFVGLVSISTVTSSSVIGIKGECGGSLYAGSRNSHHSRSECVEE